MICAIIWMWRLAPLLPFIMVKSHIIIWMTIFNNRVVRLAEVWGFIRGGLWEVKVVLWCDTCLSTKDKWRQRWICGITCFYFYCSSSSLLQTFQKHGAEEGNYFWDARASQQVFGRILSPKMLQALSRYTQSLQGLNWFLLHSSSSNKSD